MEIELLEVRDFLAHRTPFGVLSPDLLDLLPTFMTIRYLRRGVAFPTPELEIAVVIVRSGALELYNSQGHLDEKLGEGGIFPDFCKKFETNTTRYGTTAEDTLLYLLPCEKFIELCNQSVDLERYFSNFNSEKLKYAISNLRDVCIMDVKVRELLKRPPVVVTAQTSIQEAASLMTTQNVSSLMVIQGEKLVGLITDSDLRRRCLAVGLAVQSPISSIMSSTLESISLNDLLSTALMTMTRLHIHHLPVLDSGRPIGMLTVSDIARYQGTNSAFLAVDIRKATTLEELIKVTTKLPDLQVHLANFGASAIHVGQAIAHITDSLTQRLLEMAEAQLGPPPVPYVWVAAGSQARVEQTIASDQDNALILSDETQPSDDAYFATLSQFVNTGLNSCGFPYCPGGAIAHTATWRQPLQVWKRYFNNWIGCPAPKALMLAAIFFDLRPVHGDISLFDSLQQEVLASSSSNSVFVSYMVGNTLSYRPPLGFFRDFTLIHDGKHDDTLDLKHRGIAPITNIARIYALSAGSSQVNTSERLHAASQSGEMSAEMSENLRDALEFISSLRIRHQAQQIHNGQTVDNYLPPAKLSTLERSHLKDAFKIIQAMQNILASRYPLGHMMVS